MGRSVNSVQLLGNLGNDPDAVKGGIAFRLATSRRWRDSNGNDQERTDWHRVCVFGKRGEALRQIVRKGSRLYVAGELRTGEYTDESGTKRYSVDVIASDVVLCDPAPKGRTAPRDADDMPEAP